MILSGLEKHLYLQRDLLINFEIILEEHNENHEINGDNDYDDTIKEEKYFTATSNDKCQSVKEEPPLEVFNLQGRGHDIWSRIYLTSGFDT